MYNHNLDKVKREANVESDNEDFDEDLTAALHEAARWIDLKLSGYTTVPLANPPELILDIEAKIAAGLFKERKTVPVEGERTSKHIMRKTGEDWLQDYINATYSKPGASRAARFCHGKDYRRLRIDAAGEGTDYSVPTESTPTEEEDED